jgi:Gpi18-like mannosyltransferase
VLSAFYAFNPAVIINSTIWGQVDAFFTLIVAASIFALAENRIGLASALFAAAVMMKPQGIIFLPVLAFELLRQKSCMNLLKSVVIALGTAAAITLPFALNNGAPWIFRLFANTLSEYPYASVNAYNLFSLLGGNYTSDATTLFLFNDHSWGLILIVLITALGWFFYIKQHSRSFAPAVALLLIAGVFIFSTRMHERYLFPAVALAIMAFIYLRDRRLLLVALGFTATVYINTHTVFFETLKGINAAPYGPAMISASILNLLIFAYLVKVLFDIAVMKRTVPIEVFPG